jgi:hypothetical protein
MLGQYDDLAGLDRLLGVEALSSAWRESLSRHRGRTSKSR